MKIRVSGIPDEKIYRDLELIGNLFFEETKVHHEQEEYDATLTYSIEGEFLTGKFTLFEKGETYMARTPFQEESFIESKALKKHWTPPSRRVLLEILEAYTGKTQAWGILTGIRPTKLLHKHMDSGLTLEDAKEKVKRDFGVSEEKASLLAEIVGRQRGLFSDWQELKKEVSIYIGIPFCPTKCAYCTFPAFSIPKRGTQVLDFLEGLKKEIVAVGEAIREKGVRVTSVYIGGGTPTSLTAHQLEELLGVMVANLPNRESWLEWTIEAGRPDTITADKLEVFKRYGVNRISINPQSFNQETLDCIGRQHTVEEIDQTYALARSYGLTNINMDLIIGLPGEGIREWETTLEGVERLQPESLTIHTLAFKRASKMTQNKEEYEVAARDTADVMLHHGNEWAREHGYVPYYLYRQKNILGNLENVGFSKPGFESYYNVLIMEELQTIFGLGCGAANKVIHPKTGEINHFANPKDVKSYLQFEEDYIQKKIQAIQMIATTNRS